MYNIPAHQMFLRILEKIVFLHKTVMLFCFNDCLGKTAVIFNIVYKIAVNIWHSIQHISYNRFPAQEIFNRFGRK